MLLTPVYGLEIVLTLFAANIVGPAHSGFRTTECPDSDLEPFALARDAHRCVMELFLRRLLAGDCHNNSIGNVFARECKSSV